MEILIVGGNGGIGLAMVQEAAVRFPQARVMPLIVSSNQIGNIQMSFGIKWMYRKKGR